MPTVASGSPATLSDYSRTMFAMAKEAESRSPILAVICAGIAMEAALLWALESCGAGYPDVVIFKQKKDSGEIPKSVPPIRVGNNHPKDWTLAQMIEIASLKGLVDSGAASAAHGVRDWRNLVHPHVLRANYGLDGIPLEDASFAINAASFFISKLT